MSSPPRPARAHGATVLPGQTPEGGFILSALLKRTYAIVHGAECARADADRPLYPGDVFWGDPMNSCTRFESDFVPYKLATDVVLEGMAHAPHGRAAHSCRIALQIEGVRREILVIGDRTARFRERAAPTFTEPAPFTTLGLRYELAYGGIDVYSDRSTPYPYPRNPHGRGFVVKNVRDAVEGLELPNFEDPEAPVLPHGLCLESYARWEEQPFPAGFGWFPRTSLPRAALAGVLPADRELERSLRTAYAGLLSGEQRAAYLKHGLPDMNFRFFNGASRGLVLPYLKGGESIVAENLTPEGELRFNLPTRWPRVAVDIGSGLCEPEAVLHTVMIRLEQREVDLVWRAAVPYAGPDSLPGLRKLDVFVE